MTNPSPRALNALSNSKLHFTAFNRATNRPFSLSFRIARNNVEIQATTGDPAHNNQENGWGKIKIPMTFSCFTTMLTLLRKAGSVNTEYVEGIQVHNHTWENGKKSKEIVHTHDIMIVRNPEGIVSIVIHPKVVRVDKLTYVLGLPDNRYEKIVHANGEQWSRAELSQLIARQAFDMYMPLISHLLVTEYQPPEAPNGGGRSGYGGGNNAGSRPSGSTTGSRPASNYDDDDGDIPY